MATIRGILAFCLAIIFPGIAFSQIQTRPVEFKSGSNSATINSSVKGEQTIDYTISAQSGTELKVSLQTNNGANYFNVLPPGSDGEAIFIGSNEGNNFSGTLSGSGTYKIRVYLMRSAARRNEKATFTLKISRSGGGSGSNSPAAAGYNATGKLRGALGNAAIGSSSADFGVVRYGDGSAKVDVTFPGLNKRTLRFSKGEWTCEDPNCKLKYTRPGVDEWEVIINDYEKLRIPDAVIVGG